MKRFISFSILVVLLSAGIIASCSKTNDSDPAGNYTCRCQITTSGSTHSVDVPFSNVTRSYAVSQCDLTQSTYNSSGTVAACSVL